MVRPTDPFFTKGDHVVMVTLLVCSIVIVIWRLVLAVS